MKKTILVTGGAGVIGLSIIQYFYQENYNVIIAGLSSKKNINQVKKSLDKKRPILGRLVFKINYCWCSYSFEAFQTSSLYIMKKWLIIIFY